MANREKLDLVKVSIMVPTELCEQLEFRAHHNNRNRSQEIIALVRVGLQVKGMAMNDAMLVMNHVMGPGDAAPN